MSNANFMSTGIDVKTIVSSLMDIEKLSLGRLKKSQSILDNQLKSYDQLTSLLNKFSQSSHDIHDLFTRNSCSIQSSNSNAVIAALSDNNVAPGDHLIEITQLAQAHQVASQAFGTKDSALNTNGTLTVQAGATNLSVTIDGFDSLEEIRDKINHAANNTALTASIITSTAASGATEYRLMLSSRATGLSNALQISGDNPDFLNLSYEISAAQDAQFTVDKLNVVSASNTISNALEGVVFTLNAKNSSATLHISADNSNKKDALKSALQGFVDNYNSIIDSLDYNQATRNLRDSSYSLIKLRLEKTLEATIGNGGIKNLYDLGIKMAEADKEYNSDGVEYISSGKLVIDDDKMNKLLSNRLEDFSQFFVNNSSGLDVNIQNTLTDISKIGGIVYTREGSIKSQESRLSNRMDREQYRLEKVEENLTKRYSDLNIYVQKYQQMGNFIAQQLESLNTNKK
jgi:flagellar hook-associated protein 2